MPATRAPAASRTGTKTDAVRGSEVIDGPAYTPVQTASSPVAGRASENLATRLKTNRSSSPPDSWLARWKSSQGLWRITPPDVQMLTSRIAGRRFRSSAIRGASTRVRATSRRAASGLAARPDTKAMDSSSGISVQRWPCASAARREGSGTGARSPASASAAAVASDQADSSATRARRSTHSARNPMSCSTRISASLTRTAATCAAESASSAVSRRCIRKTNALPGSRKARKNPNSSRAAMLLRGSSRRQKRAKGTGGTEGF